MLRHGPQTTLYRKIMYDFVWVYLGNIAQGNCNVDPWLTDNFYEENNLYNVSTMLGQHCIGILSSQYCPNTSETTLHKKTVQCQLRTHRHVFVGKPVIVHLRLARQQRTDVDIDQNNASQLTFRFAEAAIDVVL